MAVTACHAAGGALVKQRPLDMAEAGGENLNAGNAAGGGGVDRTAASGGAVEGEEEGVGGEVGVAIAEATE